MLGHDDGSERKVRSRAGKGNGKGKGRNRVQVWLTGIDNLGKVSYESTLQNICTFFGIDL